MGLNKTLSKDRGVHIIFLKDSLLLFPHCRHTGCVVLRGNGSCLDSLVWFRDILRGWRCFFVLSNQPKDHAGKCLPAWHLVFEWFFVVNGGELCVFDDILVTRHKGSRLLYNWGHSDLKKAMRVLGRSNYAFSV